MIEQLTAGTQVIFNLKQDNSSTYGQIMPLDADAVVHFMNNSFNQDASKIVIRETEELITATSSDDRTMTVSVTDAAKCRVGDELQALEAGVIINTFKVRSVNYTTGVLTGVFNDIKKGSDGATIDQLRLREDDILVGMYPENFIFDEFKTLIVKSNIDVKLQIKVLVGGNGGV